MESRPFGLPEIRLALTQGWALASATRTTSSAYAGLFTLIGAVILGLLLTQGFTPFIIAAAGAFMLVGPAILAGFFGIAKAHEAGTPVGLGNLAAGFAAASSTIWVVALICALLFMIFITDAAILYSYMIGGAPVWLTERVPDTPGVMRFLVWGAVSGLFFAFMLFNISAFSIPLLCERRTHLVAAVVTSVRIVFGNFPAAMIWAALLSVLIITSILLLPLLPFTLPWLAYASYALYRQVLP